jgi:Lrp/AsnC family leucine-responsive transcriptional regulator
MTAPTDTGLDALDWKLIALLQDDSALSYVELGARVHASPPTVMRRVRRLIERGAIVRQVALLDPRTIGATLTAIVEVTLDAQTAERQTAFETLVAGDEAVAQCYRVAPGPDFVLVVHLRDMPAYHAWAQRVLTGAAGVRNVRVFFATHRAKFETKMPLPLPPPATTKR